jgi:N-acyl-D-amino-acid deacylase
MRRILLCLVLLIAPASASAAAPTGSALAGLEAYDTFMQALIERWEIAGAGLAVARGDRLLLVRGYGWATLETRQPVEPTSRFRLASLSKTITAVAVLRLVQDGRLSLDATVLPLLGELGPDPQRIADPRVHAITVRHLLQHSGGFDRARSGDVVFLPHAPRAAKRQGAALPPDCPAVLRDTLEYALDFAPGSRYAYSNIGYCILGRIVERASGMPYEAYVRARILAPAGADGLALGRTLVAAAGEVGYYDHRGAPWKPAMPGLGRASAPRPYGEFAMETMDSYGGWIGAPIDYLRFILAIDGRRGSALLGAAMLAEMYAAPGLAAAGDEDGAATPGAHYGLGIQVRPVKGGLNLWHGGSLPGTSTFAVRTADSFTWVAMFNGRPQDRSAFRRELDRGLWEAKRGVKRWPDGNLFQQPR